MNARSPYFASGIGHAVVLAGLLSLSALQRPPALVPGVHIVSLPGGGGGGPKHKAPVAEREPAPPPEPRPKPAPKPAVKAPPERPAPKPPDPHGARPARKQEIVSKAPSKPADVAPTPPVRAAGTGLGAGTGGAAHAGAGSGGVGFEADGEIGPLSGYLGLLRDKVAANWEPPPGDGRRGVVRAVVFFTIPRAGGQPQNLEVQMSSGISLFDRMALSAVLSAAPLQPLPSVWQEDAVGIKFTFYQEY